MSVPEVLPAVIAAEQRLALAIDLWERGDRERAESVLRELLSDPAVGRRALVNLAMVVFEQHRFAEAVQLGTRAINQNPHQVAAYVNLATMNAVLGDLPLAMQLLESALAMDSKNVVAQGNLDKLVIQTCDWDKIDEIRARYSRGVDSDEFTHNIPQPDLSLRLCLPLRLTHSVASDEADRLLQGCKPMVPWRRLSPEGVLRIGYLSPDFNSATLMHMIQGMFGLHDRTRFQVHAFFYGGDKDFALTALLEASVDKFHHVTRESDFSIADRIRHEEIDILIDLKGHAGGARPGILAWHPAPVIVNYLGYPGTLGGNLADWVIADSTVLPETDEAWYSERVMRIEGCYLPSPRVLKFGEIPPRAAHGLPEHGVVFTFFGEVHKITREAFGAWMEVLKRVPGSVMWYLEPNKTALTNLQKAAEATGVNPERLVPAPFVSWHQHIERLRLADIYLDCSEISSFASACDALRAGVPLLSLQSPSWSGRASSSVLTACGLDEFVHTSLDTLIAQAASLALDSNGLRLNRGRIRSLVQTAELFQPDIYVRRLEAALEQIATSDPR